MVIFIIKKLKLIQKLLFSPKNVRFRDAVVCAKCFGFEIERINRSHRILIHPDIPELVNLQNVKGKAKSYQIKQLLQLVEKYNLQMEGEE